MSTKKKKRIIKRPRFRYKRLFKPKQWVWWVNGLSQREVGTVICQNFETGKVRVRNEANGGELWLLNHQPTPIEGGEVVNFDLPTGRFIITKGEELSV